MGFSILGFEEDNPSQLGLVNRPHVLVENGDEGRHCDQMVVLTAEDDVRDTASSTNVPTVRDMPSDGYPYSHRASAGVANNSSTILGDMTIFRDFFLAAFSDYNVCKQHTKPWRPRNMYPSRLSQTHTDYPIILARSGGLLWR